jgi:hypothetical protein
MIHHPVLGCPMHQGPTVDKAPASARAAHHLWISDECAEVKERIKESRIERREA